MKILITGGAGFVGSHIVDSFASKYPTAQIAVVDKMTYAADADYVRNKAALHVGDIADHLTMLELSEGVDILIHAAAESHVDRSFNDPFLFMRSNALGAHSVMEAARINGVPRIVHVSTDEVYGTIDDGFADEASPFNPTNPYSASKAAAEMMVKAYVASHNLPVVTVRANNAYGIRQFPEKLIPKAIMSLIEGKRIPLHGDGSPMRHYLAASDFAEAVTLLAEEGRPGHAYNLGANVSYRNREIAEMICEQFGRDPAHAIEFIDDRLFNDRRYAVSSDKIAALGWSPQRNLADDLPGIIDWYVEHSRKFRQPEIPFSAARVCHVDFVAARAI